MSVKFAFIDAEKARYSIVKMCAWMDVSTSGFYEWRDRPTSATARRRARRLGRCHRPPLPRPGDGSTSGARATSRCGSSSGTPPILLATRRACRSRSAEARPLRHAPDLRSRAQIPPRLPRNHAIYTVRLGAVLTHLGQLDEAIAVTTSAVRNADLFSGSRRISADLRRTVDVLGQQPYAPARTFATAAQRLLAAA